MKYEFDQYKNTPEVSIQTGNAKITIIMGEAICITDAQKELAELHNGIPMVTKPKSKKGSK